MILFRDFFQEIQQEMEKNIFLGVPAVESVTKDFSVDKAEKFLVIYKASPSNRLTVFCFKIILSQSNDFQNTSRKNDQKKKKGVLSMNPAKVLAGEN